MSANRRIEPTVDARFLALDDLLAQRRTAIARAAPRPAGIPFGQAKTGMFTQDEAQAMLPVLSSRQVPVVVEYAVGMVIISAAEFNWSHVVVAQGEYQAAKGAPNAE